MIVVTGATGQLGRRIVEHLLQRVPAARVAVSVRDPEKAQDLAQRGVRVGRGDFAEPAGLAAAFEGAECVLVMSTTLAPRAVLLDRDPASPFHAAAAHAATEELIRAAGVPYTFLENDLYADGLPMMLGQALQTGVIEMPADGPVAWAAR